MCSFVSNLFRYRETSQSAFSKQSLHKSKAKILRLVTSNHSHLLWLLELKEGGCIDECTEGNVDHEHCPRPGGDFHLTWSIATWLT